MYKNSQLMTIKVMTPLHAGSGQDLGIVDMPIQREKHTGFPKVEGSGIKGSIRAFFENQAITTEDCKKIQVVFGYDENNLKEEVKQNFEGDKSKFASAISFTDARILLFPVKSVKGVFAYITCPLVLNKLNEDLSLAGDKIDFKEKVEEGKFISFNDSKVLFNKDKLILEEYSYAKDKELTKEDALLKKLVEITGISDLNERLVILSDNDFTDFTKLSTEVITRTKINNETGVVQDGALFSEEYLPAESIMYNVVSYTSLFSDMVEDWKDKDINHVKTYFEKIINNSLLQIGGNATIGKGICKISLLGVK